MKIKIYSPYHSDSDLVTEDTSIIDRFKRYNDERNDIVFVTEPNQADLIVLFEKFSFKQFDYKYRLSKSPFLREFADKIYTVNYDDIGQGFLPGCYVSLRKGNFDSLLHKSCAYPKTYNEYTEEVKESYCAEQKFMFSFRGNLKSSPVRKKLHTLLLNSKESPVREIAQRFHSHDKLQKKEYLKEILDSRFVLCPRGWSPVSYRLFETMQLGRCPVIISDEWVPIERIPWEECSIRISENQIEQIPKILSERISESLKLGKRASEIWSQYFSDKAKNISYMDKLLELRESRVKSGRRWNYEMLAKRWGSWGFRWNNGWTFPQKAGRCFNSLHKVINRFH